MVAGESTDGKTGIDTEGGGGGGGGGGERGEIPPPLAEVSPPP